MDSIVKRCLSVPEHWVWYEHHEGKYYEGGKWLHEAASEIQRLRVALERKQRPEAETIDGVIAWIKEDAERLAKARTALGEKE